MVELITGYETQQKTVTVANTDVAMNAEIATQAAETPGWIVTQIIPSGSDVILLFSRNVEIIPL